MLMSPGTLIGYPSGNKFSAYGTPGFSLTAPVLTWNSLQTDLTPEWIFDYDTVEVGDVVTLQRASDAGFTVDVDSYTDTIDSVAPITTLDFATGNWDEQIWYVRSKQARGASESDWSNTEQILLSSDVTAPVLSSPTDAVDGTTDYDGTVSTDEANGTLYWVVSTASNAPTATQIIAGQMHTGAAAAASGSQAVSGTGVQNISGSGLSTNTVYYIHYVHRDAANNNSNVSSANGFSTDVTAPTLSSPTDADATDTTGTGSVSTNEATGTLYWVVSTSATPPSAAQVKAGQMHTGAAAADSGNQAVSGTGVQNITGGFTGLTAATAYTAHYMHEDSSGNQSTVSTADGFTTQSGAGAFDVSYLTNLTDANDLSTYTFSGVSFGAADAGRKIVFAFFVPKVDPPPSITSVTIGGVTATLVTGATVGVSPTVTNLTGYLYEAVVPTGTSGTITVVLGAAAVRFAGGVWRVISGTASSGAGNGIASGSSATITPTIPTGGVGIFCAYNSSGNFNAWTNLSTEDFDKTLESTRGVSGGRRTVAGATAVTANATTSGATGLVGCAYEP